MNPQSHTEKPSSEQDSQKIQHQLRLDLDKLLRETSVLRAECDRIFSEYDTVTAQIADLDKDYKELLTERNHLEKLHFQQGEKLRSVEAERDAAQVRHLDEIETLVKEQDAEKERLDWALKVGVTRYYNNGSYQRMLTRQDIDAARLSGGKGMTP